MNDEPSAGQGVNLTLAAAWVGGIRPRSITVDLDADGTVAGVTIDAARGTTIKHTHRVFEALGITDPVLVDRPAAPGRTHVCIDDSDSFDDPHGRLGVPVTITVDTTTSHTTSHAAGQHDTTADHAAKVDHGQVIPLDSVRRRRTPSHHDTATQAAHHVGYVADYPAREADDAAGDADDDSWGS